MTSIVVLSWWILVNVVGLKSGDTVHAEGPYPSQELCRLAGKTLMPWDRQFWTDAERTAAKLDAKRHPRTTAAFRIGEDGQLCPCYFAVTSCVFVAKNQRPGGD